MLPISAAIRISRRAEILRPENMLTSEVVSSR
jgi:hypothetical protein